MDILKIIKHYNFTHIDLHFIREIKMSAVFSTCKWQTGNRKTLGLVLILKFHFSFLKTIRQTFLPPVKCRTTIFERTLWTWGRKTSCSLKLRKTPNKRRCSSNLNGKEAALSTKLRNRYYFNKICSTKKSPIQSKSFIENFLAYVVLSSNKLSFY